MMGEWCLALIGWFNNFIFPHTDKSETWRSRDAFQIKSHLVICQELKFTNNEQLKKDKSNWVVDQW